MTGVDPMIDQELRLRAALQRDLVPPATPERLRGLVAEMADEALAAAGARGARGRLMGSLAMAVRGIRIGAAAVAIVAVALLSLLAIGSLGHRGDVATNPLPTLPAMTGPALPSARAGGTQVMGGRWVSDTVAWVVDADLRMHVTTDGGQTWSGPRALPNASDLGLDLLDASNGYTAWASDVGGRLAITVHLTHDGGRTWSGTPVGSFAWADGEDSRVVVHFSDVQHGVVLAASWIYLQTGSDQPPSGATPRECAGWTTSDGGSSWTALDAPPCTAGVAWSTPDLGIGLPFNRGGDIAITQDGGRTWVRSAVPGVGPSDTLWRAFITTAGDGMLRLAEASMPRDGAVTGNQPLIVLDSTDGGATWHEAYRTASVSAIRLDDFLDLGRDHWLAIQQVTRLQGPVDESLIVETMDGGRTWTQAGTLGWISTGSVSWLDRMHGMAQGVDMSVCASADGSCGGSGTMFLTNDGGRTWHRLPF